MNTAEAVRFENMQSETTLRLDHALAYGPINEHINIPQSCPPELIRRCGTCQPSSELLEIYLPKRGIDARLYWKEIHVRRQGRMQSLGEHVLLKVGSEKNRALDPTSQQFLTLIGLSAWKVCNDRALIDLYPDSEIAVIESDSTAYADGLAEYAHELDTSGAVPRIEGEHPLHNFLRDTTLNEKIDVYRQIWDLEDYRPFFRRMRLSHKLHRSVALMEEL